MTTYAGRLMGVAAVVVLHEQAGYADLRLRGLPLGGSLRGRAHFDDSGAVVLDDALERAMARRCCRVEDVETSGDARKLVITLRLPLFGRRVLPLTRVGAGKPLRHV